MVNKLARQVGAHRNENEEVDDLSIDYPSADGERMAETDFQYIPLTNTVSALRVRYHDRPDVYVAGDMLIYYRINRNDLSIAPDVYAVFGAAGNHPRDSWLVWREGKAPDFVMEIASQSTWRRDVAQKRDIYAEMGVSEYWRFDPTGRFFTPSLVGERLVDAEYQPLPVIADEAGILRGYSAIFELDFCVLPGLDLRLFDPATGEWLTTHLESEAGRRAAEAALQSSEAGRQAAEAALQSSEAGRQAAEAALQSSEAARRVAEAEIARLREQLSQQQP